MQVVTLGPTEVIAALTGIAVALGGLSAAITKVRDGQLKALQDELDLERKRSRTRLEENRELEQEIDRYCDRITELEGQIVKVQGSISEQAAKSAADSSAQIEKLSQVIRDLEEGRIKNGEAISALNNQVRDLRSSLMRTENRLQFLVAENQDLRDQLEAWGIPDDPSLTKAKIREIRKILGLPDLRDPVPTTSPDC